MNRKAVIPPEGYYFNTCPYCCKELGKMEKVKRRIKKVCKCKYCGMKIDERFVVRAKKR